MIETLKAQWVDEYLHPNAQCSREWEHVTLGVARRRLFYASNVWDRLRHGPDRHLSSPVDLALAREDLQTAKEALHVAVQERMEWGKAKVMEWMEKESERLALEEVW